MFKISNQMLNVLYVMMINRVLHTKTDSYFIFCVTE